MKKPRNPVVGDAAAEASWWSTKENHQQLLCTGPHCATASAERRTQRSALITPPSPCAATLLALAKKIIELFVDHPDFGVEVKLPAQRSGVRRRLRKCRKQRSRVSHIHTLLGSKLHGASRGEDSMCLTRKSPAVLHCPPPFQPQPSAGASPRSHKRPLRFWQSGLCSSPLQPLPNPSSHTRMLHIAAPQDGQRGFARPPRPSDPPRLACSAFLRPGMGSAH
eukprot:359831-Chlamydomonas_euryale.AAC.6